MIVLGGVCDSPGLVDLCSPAPVIHWGWFLIQIPNLIWFALMFALLAAAIAIQMPTRRVSGPQDDAEEAER